MCVSKRLRTELDSKALTHIDFANQDFIHDCKK